MSPSLNAGTRYGRVLLVEGRLPHVDPPYRGMAWSLVLHLTVAMTIYTAILLARLVAPRAAITFQAPVIELTELDVKHDAIFLPSMSSRRGGGAAPGASGRSGGESGPNSAPAAAAGHRGEVTYRGPQTIVSDPITPDNKVQTIRRTDLIAAPVLKTDVRLPNLVMFKAAMPARATQTVEVQESKVEASLPLPEPTVMEAKLPASPAEQPRPEPSEVKPIEIRRSSAPQPVQPPKLGVKSNFPADILVINAVPVVANQATFPPGQRQGKFAVSAGNAPGTGDLPGGGKTSDGTGAAGGSGHGRGTGAAAGTGAGNGHGAGIGTGHGSGVGKGTGTGTGTSGTGPGKGTSGSGNGDASGSGSGTGTGNGSGNGKGSGGSGDDGLTIIGGVGGTHGSTARVAASPPGKTGDSYDLTIIGSSSNSSYAAAEFGAEMAYTVFINMQDTEVRGPDWTLQYCLASHGLSGLLAAPAPYEKHAVKFPDGLASRYAGRSAIVGGVVDENGKLLGLHVVRTPDAGLTASLFEALQRWQFRAAELDGKAVVVKVLITVPIVLAPR